MSNTKHTRPTIEFDLQLRLDGGGVLIANPVPGVGILTMDMTGDEIWDLADKCREARLNSLGYESTEEPAWKLRRDDVLESMGVTVEETPNFTDTALTHVKVLFRNGGSMTLPQGQLVRVNRRIQ